MKSIVIILAFFLSFSVNGQESAPAVVNNDWTVLNPDGSVEFSDELIRLLEDEEYRKEIYPESYDMDQIPELISQQEIMQCLWTMINLYNENPDRIKTIAFLLGRRGIRGQHYLSAFYSYIFTDPEVMKIGGAGGMFIQNPLVMEGKLEACRKLAALSEEVALQTNAE